MNASPKPRSISGGLMLLLSAAGCAAPAETLTRRDLYGPGGDFRAGEIAAAGGPAVAGRTDAPGAAQPTPAAPAGAATAAGPVDPKSALDDFIVLRVNQESVKFSAVFDRVRPRLAEMGPRPLDATRRQQWEEDLKALFGAALEEQINEILVFDDLWKQLPSEAHPRVRLVVDQLAETEIKKAGSRDRWLAGLKAVGSSEDQRRRELLRTVLISVVFREKVRSRIEVGPDEVRTEYERRKAEFDAVQASSARPAGEVLIKFRQIEIARTGAAPAVPGNDKPSPEQVRDYVAGRLKAGDDFAALAGKYSRYFPQRGGLAPIEELPEGSHTVAACNAALAGLKPGQIAPEPVEEPTAWYFLKLESRAGASAAPAARFPPLGESAARIREELEFEKLHREHRRYLTELQNKAWIGKPDIQRVHELLLRRAAAG
jgi:parvulin-like peptidyl-prolyl isomerase